MTKRKPVTGKQAFRPIYRHLVTVIDVDSGEIVARDVTLQSCFPDDRDAARTARRDIRQYGSHLVGGGAAPLFRIEEARHDH